MSLINDALKQARQAPPRNAPDLPPLQPVAAAPASGMLWLIPAFIAVLVLAAAILGGWVWGHRMVRPVATEPEPVAAVAMTAPVAAPEVVTPPATAPVAAPVPEPAPAPAVTLAPEPAANPTPTPVLQGIFYSPTAPSAIVDGKTVRPGESVGRYQVKTIGKFTVTLVDPDHNEIQLGLNH